MKKEKSAFNELLAKYNEFAERKANRLFELADKHESAEREIKEIRYKLSGEVSTMSAEDYIKNEKRINELEKSLELYEGQAALIETRPGTTDEEYADWIASYIAEHERIKAEVQTETFKLLKQFVDFYEKDITEFEKLRMLRYSFEGAVGNRKNPYEVLKNLPPYVNCICRVLLIYYNELEELINNGEHKTKCVDDEEIKRSLHEISQTGSKAGFSALTSLTVPTWNEAYNEIKYNKPWTV